MFLKTINKTINKTISFLKMPFLFILFAYLTMYALLNLKGLDYFFHIKSGEYIVTQKEIPKEDIFSFTMEKQKWTNHEWLYQVIIYSLYKNFGLEGLFFLRLSVIFLAFLILLLISLRIDWFASFLLLFFGLKMSFIRFTLRPDHFSFLFFILFLVPFVFNRRKTLFLLPLIQLLWVNIHGFFFLGPLILIIYLLTGKIGKTKTDRPFYNTVKLVLLLSILACFLNPYPISTLIYPFKILGDIISGAQKTFYQYIQELQDPFKDLPLNSLYFKYFIVTVLSLLFLKDSNIFYVCLWLFVFLFSFNSVRNLYFFVPMGIIIFIDRYPYIKEFLVSKILREKGFEALKVILVILIIIACTRTGKEILSSPKFGRSYLDLAEGSLLEIKSRFLSQDAEFYPEKMVAYMKSNKLPGEMFNTFNLGAYLIFNFFPERRVFIDGRAEFYGPEFFDFYHKIIDGDKDIFKAALAKYKLQGFIICYTRTAPPPLIKLLYDEGFKCVYFDRDGIIFVSEDFLNKNRSLKSQVVNFKIHKVKEIDFINNVKLYRPSMEGYYNMAYILNMLNFDEASKGYLEEVLKVHPDHYYSYYLLAISLQLSAVSRIDSL